MSWRDIRSYPETKFVLLDPNIVSDCSYAKRALTVNAFILTVLRLSVDFIYLFIYLQYSLLCMQPSESNAGIQSMGSSRTVTSRHKFLTAKKFFKTKELSAAENMHHALH